MKWAARTPHERAVIIVCGTVCEIQISMFNVQCSKFDMLGEQRRILNVIYFIGIFFAISFLHDTDRLHLCMCHAMVLSTLRQCKIQRNVSKSFTLAHSICSVCTAVCMCIHKITESGNECQTLCWRYNFHGIPNGFCWAIYLNFAM